MSEMVERVARDIFFVVNPNRVPWEETHEVIRRDYREQARAAIKAMMEPTEEMRLAGDAAASVEQNYPLNRSVAVACLQAMLTAALEESKE